MSDLGIAINVGGPLPPSGGASPPPAPAPLLDGLIAYWGLDGVLDSHGPNHLTNQGNVAFVPGKLGNAANFFLPTAGQGLYLANLALPTMWSVSVWVNARHLGASIHPFVILSADDTLGALLFAEPIAGSYGRIKWYVGDGAALSGSINDADLFEMGQWYHIIAEREPGFIRLFINNGAATPAPDNAVQPALVNHFYIGRWGLNNGHQFPGLIDDMAIWGRLLTPQERAALYNGGAGWAYPFL